MRQEQDLIVHVDLHVRAHRIPPGSYQIWLVNLYRDDSGDVIGCSASPFDDLVTVGNGAPVDFHGSIARFSGDYELQVYLGPISGPGYASSPTTVTVP